MLTKDNFVFVTCGDWDLNTCLRQEVKAKQIKLPAYFNRYINIKAYFPKVLQSKAKIGGMMQMLDKLNIKHEGKHHSGIDDVRNISKICTTLLSKYDAKFPKG
jgi:ERI1 exoribonuclease 3